MTSSLPDLCFGFLFSPGVFCFCSPGCDGVQRSKPQLAGLHMGRRGGGCQRNCRSAYSSSITATKKKKHKTKRIGLLIININLSFWKGICGLLKTAHSRKPCLNLLMFSLSLCLHKLFSLFIQRAISSPSCCLFSRFNVPLWTKRQRERAWNMKRARF